MRVSVIIPAHNEEATLGQVIEKVHSLPLEKEIIVVDDGSRDGTPRVLSELADKVDRTHRFETNRGKGSAIRKGFELASGEIIAVQDADLELDPEMLPVLVEPIAAGQAAVVFGSRFLGRRYSPTLGETANRFLTGLTNLLYGCRLTDMETGYKVGKADLFKSLPLRACHFEIEPEITGWLIRSGYRIHEIPVGYSPRSRAEGKSINWRDGLSAMRTLVKVRFSRLRVRPAIETGPPEVKENSEKAFDVG